MGDRPANKRASLWWLLVLVALVLVWFVVRPAPEARDSAADPVSAAELESLADPDDVLVDLRDDLSDEEVAALGAELGVELVLVSDQSADERFYRAHVPYGTSFEVAERLSAHEDVEFAEPDAHATLAPLGAMRGYADLPEEEWKDFPNDPKYSYQWHLEQIRMPSAWKLADGNGVVVAVLDTGVAYEDFERFHMVEDLAGVEMVKPYDFVGNDSHANDDHGHGTHVAGTIAQATHNGVGVAGVARNVKIMPLKVLSGSGSGSVGGIADAIRYAADEGAHVINMSLGSRFPSKALERAVKYAYDKGVVVVAAAGNDGRGKVGYPAAHRGAIAVAATQFDEKTTFYSNWGKEIDVAAPGGNTRLDQNGDGMPDGVLQNTIEVGNPTKSDYFGFMGTSMASPHVAGVAALVVGEGVTDPDAVEAVLEETARDPNGQALDSKRYGAGIVDAEAAVLKARQSGGGWQFLIALLLAGAALAPMRRSGALASGVVGGGFFAALTIGASGLFFLPALFGGLSSVPGVELLTRGLPSWGAALGPDVHGNVLLFSALIPALLVALLSGLPKLRGVLAGLALGVGAHLLFHAVADITEVRWMAFDALWLTANAAICVGLGKLALRR